MTESEWASRTDPQKTLLALLRGGASERKLRLFACACVRDVWELLTEGRSRGGVEVSERYADGLADGEELWQATILARKVDDTASRAVWLARGAEDSLWRAGRAASAAAEAAGRAAARAAAPAGRERVVPAMQAAEAARQAAQCLLARCIFGDPWRPPALPAAWRTADVAALAQSAYEERLLPSGRLDPARLAVLCDALEEAGCPAEHDLLLHLRGPSPHVRGCWAIDHLTGRE